MKVAPKKSKAKTKTTNGAESAIDLEEQIRCRAYEFYEQRGRADGRDIEDWLQAEAELMRERTMPPTGAAVKKNRKPPVTSSGETKVKRARKSKSAAQSKMEEERSGN